MRVHLRGVVIGVGVVLSVVVIVAVFNTYDTSANTSRDRYSTEDSLRSRKHLPKARNSRSSPRSSARLRPARAGGGGGGARGGGSGGASRAAGMRSGGVSRPGGGGRKMGGTSGMKSGANDAFDLDAMDTLTDEAEESPFSAPARRRGGGSGGKSAPRASGAASREKSSSGIFDKDEPEAEDDEEAPPVSKKKLARASREKKEKAASAEAEKKEDDEDSEEEESKSAKRKKHKKKRPDYPEWWTVSYSRSGVSQVQDQFVGDQPLFSECPIFQEVGEKMEKIKRYGHLDRPHFLQNSKNPCWFESTGKKDIIKCLPYFYISGVPKAAVGDLFQRLIAHPTVLKGEMSAFYWWDRTRYGAVALPKYTKELKRTIDPVNIKEYSKKVVGSYTKNITRAVLYFGSCDSVIGEASPTYMVENTQWDIFEANDGCSEPRIIPASFMYHAFPQARIIIVLRDPIERLYARFLSSVPEVDGFVNHTASLFHTFTVQAVESYRACFARTSIRQCVYNATLYSNAVIRLSEGMYSIFLQDWLRIFPREQILIIKHEEYISDVKGHVAQTFRHLGVGQLSEYTMQKIEEMKVVRKGKKPKEEGYLIPDTVALLKEFYEPFNMHLAELLDDDKWLFPRKDPIPVAPLHVDVEEEGNQPPDQPAVNEEQPIESAPAPAAVPAPAAPPEQPAADSVGAGANVDAGLAAGSVEGGGGGGGGGGEGDNMEKGGERESAGKADGENGGDSG